MDELGLPALTGMAAALVAFTVSAIDAFKTYVLRGWAGKVPSVVWYILAIGIPTGICIALGLDWFSAVTGEEIPAGLEPYSAAATGVIVGIGASGSYKAKEGLKAIKAESMKAEGKAVPEYLTPPGEPGIPAPEPCPPPEPEAGAPAPEPPPAPAPEVPPAPAPTATLFLKLCHPGDSTYVLIEDEKGQHIYPVQSTD